MAIQNLPLINGVAHSWGNIIVDILGRPVNGITSISYGETQDFQDNYGAGVRPVTRGIGNITATASITLQMEEVFALQTIAPGGELYSIPEFPITVMYMSNIADIKTDVLKNVRFKGNSKSWTQNDMTGEVTIELQVSHIEWSK